MSLISNIRHRCSCICHPGSAGDCHMGSAGDCHMGSAGDCHTRSAGDCHTGSAGDGCRDAHLATGD